MSKTFSIPFVSELTRFSSGFEEVEREMISIGITNSLRCQTLRKTSKKKQISPNYPFRNSIKLLETHICNRLNRICISRCPCRAPYYPVCLIPCHFLSRLSRVAHLVYRYSSGLVPFRWENLKLRVGNKVKEVGMASFDEKKISVSSEQRPG